MITPDELARIVALQRVIQHAVAAPELAEIEQHKTEGYRALGVPARDGAALAESDTRRIVVYRKLVRGTLVDAVRAQIPRTAARLGDRYGALVDAWVETELPRSQVLRDVAYELAVWAEPQLRAEEPYLADLLRYELFEFDSHVAVDRNVVVSDELAADQIVAFSGSTRLARFDHAVHRLVDDVDDRTIPEAGRTGVLGYRDENGRFRQMVLTPMATAIVAEMLIEGQPLAAAVRRACTAESKPVTPRLLEAIGKVIEDLAQRGVILGGHRDGPPPPDPSPYFRWLYDAARGASPPASEGAGSPPAPS
jgi:hypothetical protein